MARYQVTLDIALRWSAGIRFVAFYRHWGSLSQNLLSRAQFARLISLSSRLIAPYKEWWTVPTLQLITAKENVRYRQTVGARCPSYMEM